MRLLASAVLLVLAPAGSAPTGAPSFTHTSLALDEAPIRVRVAQLDALDGHADLALLSHPELTWKDRRLRVLRGDGQGAFAPSHDELIATGYGGHDGALYVVDVNHDAHADLVSVGLDGDRLTVRLGDGSGAYPVHVSQFTYGGYMEDVSFTDFDGDGWEDAVLILDDLGGVFLEVLLNQTDGTFEFASFGYGPSYSGPARLQLSDFDGDGAAEALVGSQAGLSLTGLFGSPQPLFPENVRDLVSADLDGDGDLDIAAALPFEHSVRLLRNDGAGGFGDAFDLRAGRRPVAVSAFDHDLDGLPDLAVANSVARTVGVYSGLGQGRFAAAEEFAVMGNPVDVEAADIDEDGDVDLVVPCDGDPGLSFLLNTLVP